MAPKRRYSELSQDEGSLEGDAGTIEKIYLENFMCHDKLEVSFDEHINFVVGANGRFPSAIPPSNDIHRLLRLVFGRGWPGRAR